MPSKHHLAATEAITSDHITSFQPHQMLRFPARLHSPFHSGEAASASEEAAAHLYIARRESLRRCLLRAVLFVALKYKDDCVTPTVRISRARHCLPSQESCLVGLWHPNSIIMASSRIDISHSRQRESIDALTTIEQFCHSLCAGWGQLSHLHHGITRPEAASAITMLED